MSLWLNLSLFKMRSLSLSSCRFFFSLGVVVALPAAGQPVVHSQSAPVRDHQLFVGVNLVMNHEGELVDVRKIEKKKAQLDNETREVVALRDSRGLQWRLVTKVAATSATVDAFKTKRVLSPAKNPALKQLRDKQALMAFADGQREQKEAELAQTMRAGGETPSADAAEQTDEEAAAEVAGITNEISAISEMGEVFDQVTNEARGKDGFDAVQVSFEISSPTPIADAYVVAIMRITVDGDFHDTSFYRHVGPVDASPRKVKFLQAGLPSDFEIVDARVHLYWHGEEIPTNMSEKNYAVTAGEAKMYLQTDHLGRHRFDAAAASPAWSIVPPALLAAKNPAEYDIPVTVELDAEGQLVSIQTGNLVVPANVRSVVEQMTFVPAVERGKGVAATLTVNPADFFKVN